MAMECSGQSIFVKTILIGDCEVGKSNLLTRYIIDEFYIGTASTIGVEFMTKALEIGCTEVKAQIWDTAGQERFRAITRSLFHGTNGAMVVYSITCQTSFDNVRGWLDELETHAPANIPIMLVGNKCDLEQMRQVPVETGRRFAQERGLLFLETSALDATNVEKAFEWLIRVVVKEMSKPSVVLPSKKTDNLNVYGMPFGIVAPGLSDANGGKACGCKA